MRTLPACAHEASEVARAPSLTQLAQRLRLDLANTFARDGKQFADLFGPFPILKRIRRICSSRGVSVAMTLRVSSPRLREIAASTGIPHVLTAIADFERVAARLNPRVYFRPGGE